jgi:hypothetical protein
MDVLSEVLKVVRLQGALFYNGEFSSPWSVYAAHPRALARYFAPDSEHVIEYHLLTEGRASVRLENGGRLALAAGDIVMIPHGDPHIVENGPASMTVDDSDNLPEVLSQGLKLRRLGGGGEVTRFVCGYMACEPRLSQVFLSGLPPVFKVNIRKEASGRWLEDSIRFSVNQADTPHAGGDAVLARLSEVLFVETLRSGTNRLAGRRARCRGRENSRSHAPQSRASLDPCFSGQRSWDLTLGARRTLSSLPQRNSHGLPYTLAIAVGCATAYLYKSQRRADRRRSRLRIRSGV